MTMYLRRVQVENLRQYVAPAVLNDLLPGINLFIGPNGSGKSTWIRAIRAAFFERHRSKVVSDLVPWAAPSAAPEISLTFELDGESCEFEKRFMHRQSCVLRKPDGTIDADEAEQFIATAFGFETAAKGASKPELMGIPGLLWIEQGDVPEVAKPVQHALSHLRDALQGVVGEITSSAGDEILDTLETALGRLRGKAGQSGKRGSVAELREVDNAVERLETEVQAQRRTVEHFRERVDELGRLHELVRRDEAERPWEKLEAKARELTKRLAAAVALRSRQEQLETQMRAAQSDLDLLRNRLAQRRALSERLALRKTAVEKFLLLESECMADERQATQAARAAGRALDAARASLDALAVAGRRRELLAHEIDLRQRIGQHRQSLQHAITVDESINQLAAQIAAIRLSKADVEALRKRQNAIDRSAARLESVALRVQWSLHPSVTIELDEHKLSADGEITIAGVANLRIAQVGTLRVEPGGIEIDALRRDSDALNDEQRVALAMVGVQSISQAVERLETLTDRQQQHMAAAAQLLAIAPDGMDAKRADAIDLEGQLAGVGQALSALPADDETALAGQRAGAHEAVLAVDDEPALAVVAAGSALDETAVRGLVADRMAQATASAATAATAAAALAAARAELRLARQEVTDAEQLIRVADQRPDRASESDDATRLDQTQATLITVTTQLEMARASVIAVNVPALELNLNRLSESTSAARQAATQTREKKLALAAELSGVGASGLEESLALTIAERDRMLRRQVELTRRADALEWLVNELRTRRAALTRRLQAPLQARLDHYTSYLFAGARIVIDEDLVPIALHRVSAAAGPAEPLTGQSFGTREQLALLARLAYADLLAQAGRATMIMLDDGLVHADDVRLDSMKLMLFDAAKRHQILIFSCHPQRWTGLGVVPRDVPHPTGGAHG